MKMKINFESDEAIEVNRKMFETIYYAALVASNELAMETSPYETFKGSPLSEGIFQFDMWDVKPSNRHDWNSLRESIMRHGVKNSLFLAPMPTASTSQILGNNEAFEPYTSNIYIRRVLAGEFILINPHLVRDLIAIVIKFIYSRIFGILQSRHKLSQQMDLFRKLKNFQIISKCSTKLYGRFPKKN